MKKVFLLISMFLFSLNVMALDGHDECESFYGDEAKVQAISFVAKLFSFESKEEFCTWDKMYDLEVTHAPNLWILHEEDDHHIRVMAHFAYSSCTLIYNQTQNKLSKKDCYSTW